MKAPSPTVAQQAALRALVRARRIELGQHEALGRFLVAIFGEPPAAKAARRFDQLRRERNQQRYDAKPVGEANAKAARVTAEALLDAARFLVADP